MKMVGFTLSPVRTYLIIMSSFFSLAVSAQNKSLGVGITTPSANAALHVESPTNNQGMIVPRLSTAQRTAPAFLSALTASDKGLLVYDRDLDGIFIWNGSAWESGAKLQYPYVDTITTSPGTNSNLLRLVYVNGATENVGVAHFENLNANSGFSALFARTNSATNGAVDLVVNNSANNNDAIGVVTNGVGTAGRFLVNNAANQSAAIYATTNGTPGGTSTNSAAILGETNTAFSAITGRVNSGQSNAISGVTSSTDPGSWAGYFQASTGTAVYASTASNLGGALAPVAVYGESTGTGSVGGAFWVQNAANGFPALYTNTLGTGNSASFNSANNAATVRAQQNGLGSAANLVINNASNTNSAVAAQTNGTGPAFSGDNTSTGDIFFGSKSGANGSAGNFQINNASNPASALFASTNAANGFALGLINNADGEAVSIFAGGMRVSVSTLAAGTSITTRAVAYYITGGGPYTFAIGLTDGEVFYFYNNTGSPVTVNGVSIGAGAGRSCIVLGSALRGM